ncbi:hypothetical protein DXT88_22055 [Herbaspirillum lusitanum]|uniref:hypothetical protein n=1 Tax=Herbaspirillum lusitanum TaxID=213312 RepID=UPI0022378A02|nr:hypothetical protein [Herbaspirillum lusitanum]MCW5300859.1 hypothetical protein [Herbaspirillum lusitanum]
MNYTESLDNVVHAATAQRMHTDTAAIPTTFSAKDANMLIWSMMEVIKRSGLPGKTFNPDDATSYRVFLNALERLYPQKQLLVTSGTGAAYVITPDVTPDAYSAGLFFRVRFHSNSLANPTLKVGAGDLPSVALKQYDSTGAKINALMVTDLISDVMFDGTNFVLLDPLPSPSALPSGTPLHWPTLDCPTWAVVRDGSSMTRTVYPALFSVLAPLRACNITANAAGAIITGLARTSDMWVGMPAEHANLPAGTTIKSIDSAVQVTLSANATGALAGTTIRFFLHGYGNGGSVLTFGLPDDRGLFERGLDSGARAYEQTTLTATTTAGSDSITAFATTRGMFVGMALAHANLPAGTTVKAILSATSVQASAAATVTGASVKIITTGGQIGAERGHTSQGHRHQTTTNPNFPYATGGTIGDFLYVNGTVGNITSGVADPTTDGANGTPQIGPETRGRFRNYLAIMVI